MEWPFQPFFTSALLQKAQHLTPLYERIHSVLASEFSHILAPLPSQSFHVTLSLFLYRGRSERVEQFNQLMALSHDRLERMVYVFRQLPSIAPLTWHFAELMSNGSGVTALVQPKTAADVDRLDTRISLAQQTPRTAVPTADAVAHDVRILVAGHDGQRGGAAEGGRHFYPRVGRSGHCRRSTD